MNKLIKKTITCIWIVIMMFAFDVTAFADEETEEPDPALLYVTEYAVDNQTIIPGKEFTLKLKVENYSAYVSAKDIVVMIDDPKGVVPEYGTLSVQYIDYIGPKSSKEIVLRYTADAELQVSELDFVVYISWDSQGTSTPLRISVGREGVFSVDEFTVPDTLVIGKKEYISALVENVSDKDMDNVSMVLKCDGEILTSQSIGTMLSGTSKTQYVSVQFEEGSQGQHSYELLLTYTDGSESNKEYIITSGVFTISDEASNANQQDNTNNTQSTVSEENSEGINNIVLICSVGILFIAICCVVLLMIYRRK